VYTHMTEIEADHRRDRLAEQFHNAQRRNRRADRPYFERRWQGGRRHAA
jgi:hypothetical protein